MKELKQHRFIKMFMKHNNISFCLKTPYFTTNAVLHTHHLNFQSCNCPHFRLQVYSTASLSVAYLFFIIYSKSTVGQLTQIKIYSKLSANSSIVLTFSSFIVDLIVTTGSTISIFLNPSTIPFMIFAAIGAHDPFSINATLRF